MKENLKPCVNKQSNYEGGEPQGAPSSRMACLLQNEPASYVGWQVKLLRSGAEAKASPKRAIEEAKACSMSAGVDPKPGDLAMARLKLG